MPRMNGYEVLMKLRADETIRDTPVMMMTALTRDPSLSDEQMANSAGANAFLSKPFELEALLNAVEKITGVRI